MKIYPTFCTLIPKFIIIVILCFACGCQKVQDHGSIIKKDFTGRQIKVITTTGMVADIAINIGGERVQVTGLMGPGVDPHLYKASEGDVIRMATADIIFYNGLHLEGKMTELFSKMTTRVRTFAVSDGIDRSLLLTPPQATGAYDPHVWFDVTLWMRAAEHVRDAFLEIDPGSAEVYRRNTQVYLEKLMKLNDHVISQVERIPPDKRVLITAHDAFHYFGKAYGFEVKGLQGISTAAETGTSDVQELTVFIVRRKIPAVFIETSVPTRFIEALQESVAAKGYRVDIGGHLFSDAMGTPGTPEGTYTGMVRHNIDTIVNALIK